MEMLEFNEECLQEAELALPDDGDGADDAEEL